MQAHLIELIATILGAIIGSFLSVCIYRIPIGRFDNLDENGEQQPSQDGQVLTVSKPARSFCPHCKNSLRWYHNIPLLSWLALRGKCGFCKAPISGRYPLVELLSAFSAYQVVYLYGPSPTAAVIYAGCAALIVITFIDYDFFIIPNLITYPGILIGFIIAGVNQLTGWFSTPPRPGTFVAFNPISHSLIEGALGFAAGAGFLYFVSEVYLRLRKKDGLGMGDVKLLGMLGAVFGPACSLFTIFVGSLLGSLIGITLVLIGGRKMGQYIPFGPYLAAGAAIALFWGKTLTSSYLGLVY